jgi:predicted HTH domain antitoxin
MLITVKMSDIHFASLSQSELSQQVKLYTALMMYYNGTISAGAACEIADIDRFTFIYECKKNKIPVINYTIDDIQNEITQFQSKAK